MKKKDYSLFVRNFTFGVEDSLVSTVGLLAGIAVAGVDRKSIILTGLVLIFVEAFSMAVGSLISERSVEEYQTKTSSMVNPVRASGVMFFSYVIAGVVPLAPYFALTGTSAMASSISLALLALFVLGAANAKMFRSRVMKDGLFTLTMGGLAILVGVLIGQLSGKLL